MRSRQRAFGAAVLLLTASSPAQGGWDIPDRGALVYDRATERFVVRPRVERFRFLPRIESDGADGHVWRYWAGPVAAIPDGFEKPGFDDTNWRRGRAEFGTEPDEDTRQHTLWKDAALCLRTEIELPRKPKALSFLVDHDDGIRIWFNGHLIVSNDGYGRDRRYVAAGDEVGRAWQRGKNLLAIRCVNRTGAQYCDVAVSAVESVPPRVRTAAEIRRALLDVYADADRARRSLFADLRNAPILLEGELDGDHERILRPPTDLRDMAFFVATDLRFADGGAVAVDAARRYGLGDLEIRGRATPRDPEGWQTIEATCRTTTKQKLRGDSKRYVERHVLPFIRHGFDGTIRIRRRIVASEGGLRVTEIHSELAGEMRRGKDRREPVARLVHRETWRLATVRDNEDAAFRAMVRKAIERGVARLRERLASPSAGRLAAESPKAQRTYSSGRLAIGLLALIKGGLPKDDDVIQRGLAELRRRRLIDTYSIGNALMALSAYYAPPSEIGDLKAGTIDRPRKRRPSPEDLELMRRWSSTLLGNLDDRVDPNYVARFHYVGGRGFDNSVTQYGLLGLYAAHLCGVEIRAEVWKAAINHLLAVQESAEGKKRIPLDLTDYRTHARRGHEGSTAATNARILARPLGWGYRSPRTESVPEPIYGSMTCAGITGLAICQAALADHPKAGSLRLQGLATEARHSGFAWLAENLTVRCHPGSIVRQRRWYYYYLYSLERASLLSGIARIQGRDWYFEGAMMLSLAQQPNGDWPGELFPDLAVELDAMALLFLEQSTLPVLTGR